MGEVTMGISGLRRERTGAIAALLIILLLGAALRFTRLGSVPPGFQFDEAYNAIDAVHVLEGEWQIFFPANGGREPLYTYWQALFFAFLGPTLTALRLSSAVVGVITLPMAFGAIRTLFRDHPRANALGLLTAGFMAVSFWHLHFSHYAIRAITLPPILLATLWAFWYGQATGRLWAFLAAGAGLAAGAYAHPAARFLPFLLIFFTLYDTFAVSGFLPAIRNPKSEIRNWLGLCLTGLVALVLFLPLGLYFLKHPWLFAGHPSDVSIFDPRVNQGDLAGTLLRHALQLAGMFLWRGDPAWLHNLPGRPVFDPISGLAFLAGVLVWARALLRPWTADGRPPRSDETAVSGQRSAVVLDRRPYLYLGAWIVLMAFPSFLSDNPPNFSRAIGALPAICAFPALGLVAAWELLRQRPPTAQRPRSAVVLAGLVLLASGLWTARDYYIVFAHAPEAYYWYDGDKVEVVEVLADLVEQGQVYMAPPWVKHATVDFLTRGWGIKEAALGTGLVLPNPAAVRDAYYVLRAKDAGESRFVGRQLGPSDEVWTVHDRYGEPLLFIHRLPAEAIPDGVPGPAHEMRAVFGDLFELLGYTMDSSVEAGERLNVLLFWRSLRPAPLNYTQFLHLLDQDGRRWGQRDREPLDGTYRTSAWEPGEVIVDRFRLPIHPCAPPGPYELLVGWYDLETGERLSVAGGALGALELATLQVRPARGLSADQVAPQHRLDAALSGAIRLLGYDGDGAELRSGDELPLTLYWQATGPTDRDREIAVQVRDPATGRVWQLGRGAPPVPTSQWAVGEVICDHRRLRLPLDLPGGAYRMEVALDGQAVALEGLTLQVRERRFALPQPQVSLKANLGDQVALLGYDLKEARVAPGGTLHLTLYWQAQAEMDVSYTVFTHLLDAQQRIWGQVDSVPVRGTYPTTGWLPGEVVADEYAIPVAPDAPPGVYAIEVGMYDAATGIRLPVTINGLRVPDDRVLLDITVDVR